MYCSTCGQPVTPGQGACTQCGRTVAQVVPLVANISIEFSSYAGKIRTISMLWLIYAGLIVLSGFGKAFFLHSFLNGQMGWLGQGPWGHGEMPLVPFAPFLMHMFWVKVIVRTALAIAAGWGLMEHTGWGRAAAIAAAFLSLLAFPLGTALGIYTLVLLLGYRNATLYEQL